MKLNEQEPWSLNNNATEIHVHSIFKTIQGEGPFAGRPAIFVRLAGCNLKCPLCDTEYTSLDSPMTPIDLLHQIEITTGPRRFSVPLPLIVITGGEPFRQDLHKLLWTLLEHGYEIQIETNDTLSSNLTMTLHAHARLSIVCSPKTSYINKKLEPFIDAFKYIVKAGEISDTDGLPTRSLDHPTGKGILFRPDPTYSVHKIYLQPLDEQNTGYNQDNSWEAAVSCMKFGYTLSLQMHKIIGLQ